MPYYNKANRSAVPDPAYDPLNPDHIELDPSHVFYQQLPDGHEYTFDLNNIPNGTQPRAVSVDSLIKADLRTAGITHGKLLTELFKQSQALPNDLSTIYADMQAIAALHSVTTDEVINVMG